MGLFYYDLISQTFFPKLLEIPHKKSSIMKAYYLFPSERGMDMTVLLKAIQMCKSYQMGEVRVDALKNVDFEIYKGEFIVVLGPSGSGKSTMINLIGGMDTASAGEIYYQDRPLT